MQFDKIIGTEPESWRLKPRRTRLWCAEIGSEDTERITRAPRSCEVPSCAVYEHEQFHRDTLARRGSQSEREGFSPSRICAVPLICENCINRQPAFLFP